MRPPCPLNPTRTTPRTALASLILLTLLFAVGCLPLPRLMVTLLSVPDVLWPGSPVPVTVRVCNQGTYDATNGSLWLFLREAGDPASEQPLHSAALPPLLPGECFEEAVVAPMPPLPDGAYEVVARTDAGLTMVPLATNHQLVSAPFGIGYGPDLRVRSLGGPASAGLGEPFTVTAEVCNAGNGYSPPTDAYVYLSEDAVLDGVGTGPPPPLPDPFAGTFTVPDLPSGACATVQEIVHGSVPEDGEYFLAVWVDESNNVLELVEINNTAMGDPMGVGYAPDLVVAALSAPPSAHGGSPFDVTFELCNQGTTSSPPSTLSLYLSEDDAIEPSFPDPTAGDWHVDEISVDPLEPGECRVETAEVVAGAPADGAWFLGALLDEQDLVVELRESNNDAATGPMGIGSGPDLVVRAITAPHSVQSGASFDSQVEVCNQGTTSSFPSYVRLALSLDTELSPLPEGPDPDVGDAPVPPLAPGECVWETVPANAFTLQDGPHYVLARADGYDDVPELVEVNNDFAGPLMGIGFEPDLVVTAISAPPSIDDVGPFDATATVCNRGTDFSTATEVVFLHSEDETIDAGFPGPPEDAFAGSLALAPLEPGRCATVGGSLDPSVTSDGAYYLGAVADAWENVDELIETNNAFTGFLQGVGFGPDLVVTDVGGPPNLPSNDLSELSFEVCNQGTDTSGPTWVHLYVSDDTVIETDFAGPGPSDYLLGDVSIPPLAVGECHVGSDLFWIQDYLEGVQHLGAYVDQWETVDELIETNNTHASEPVGIGNGADLVVGTITAPHAVYPNDPVAIDVEVCNQGTDTAVPAWVNVYLSEDDVIEGILSGPPSPDMHVDTLQTGPLPAGTCTTVSSGFSAAVPFDGPWHIGAIADEEETVDELIETNNVTAGPLLAVGAGPDLVVTSLVGPPTATQGVGFDVDVTACNHGTDPSPVSEVLLYHTQDTTIEGAYSGSPWPDAFLIDVPLPPLAPGACHSELKTVSAFPPAMGPGWLAATVDEIDSVPEIVETNNALLGTPLEVVP